MRLKPIKGQDFLIPEKDVSPGDKGQENFFRNLAKSDPLHLLNYAAPFNSR